MHVLITNDDGINSPGIRALWEEFIGFCKVTIVAPDKERSACSHSITVHRPLCIDKYHIAGVDIDDKNVTAYQLGGTPADCVKIAIKVLLDDTPDIIISGINNGSNLGTEIFYSGTVSAAIEGVINGIPSMAVSLVVNEMDNYAYAAKVVKRLAVASQDKKIPNDVFLNVNIPDVAEESIKGTTVTKLGFRYYKNTFEQRLSPQNKPYYWLGGEIVDEGNEHDSDVSAIKDNKISITPVHLHFTHEETRKIIENWNI